MSRLRSRLFASKFVRDTAWTFGIKLGTNALAFAVAVVLARMLGAEGYGVYAYALALVTLLALPAQVGFPALLMRETAKGMASDKPQVVRGVWNWAGRATGVLSLALGVGAVVVLLLANQGTLDEQALTMIWAVLLVPFVALGALRGAALRGLGRMVAGQIPEDLIRPMIFLALIAGYGVIGRELLPSTAMVARVVAAAVAFGIGAWLLVRHTPSAVRTVQPEYDGRYWLRSSIPLALMAGLVTVNAQADILILGLFDSPDQIGIYRVAVQVAALAAFGLYAINIVLAPRIAELYMLNQKRPLQRIVTITARAALAFSLAAAAFFATLGRPLLSFVFGSQFSQAYQPLLIILVGQVVNATAGSVTNLLNMTGHERDSLNGTAIAAALNVVLNFALIPTWGVAGAATATAVSLATQNIFLWAVVRKRLRINSLAFGPSPLDERA